MKNSKDQLLIITNSTDQTVDVLFDYLPFDREKVFRLNFDLFKQYQLQLTPTDFRIIDPLGRTCRLEHVRKLYFRKPSRNLQLSGEEAYVQEELWYTLRSLINLCWWYSKLVLVEPFAESARLDKFAQIRIAQKYFDVPQTLLTQNSNTVELDHELVVKSLTSTRIDGKAIFTTKVDPKQLAPQFPWFFQDYVQANSDLTIVYVRGKIFPFHLKRTFADTGSDWREYPSSYSTDNWKSLPISDELCSHIRDFMQDVRLDYGRLDFLLDPQEQAHFLEINPNGQYAWLDLENRQGLLSAILEEVSPETELHSLPYNPFV